MAMKNTYPGSALSSQNGAQAPSLFYLFGGAAVLSLILRVCNLVNDGRLLWASLILFAVSILLFKRNASHRRVHHRIPLGDPYANSVDVPMESPTTPAAPLAPVTAAKAAKAEDPRIAEIVAKQESSHFMTLEEFRGEVPGPSPTSSLALFTAGTHLTQETLALYQEAHLVWLERGALPDANGRAVLVHGDFQGEDLRGVILARANLQHSRWTGAFLSDANLSGATLFQADLSQTDLRGADFREADLRECQLVRVDGRGADLRGAELIQAKLIDANLSGADLSEAYLSGADLTGADLSGAKLDGAYLSGALLLGADLTGSSLEGIDLRRARYDMATRWPARFEPRSCGAILSSESSGGDGASS
jgi:uncharacterized protein YjbI with pentapeptide repeats